MKKSTLAAAVLLSLGVTAAQAAHVSIDITTMKFYDATGTPGFYGGGLNTSVNTTVNFSTAGTGAANSGPTSFFGTPWTATQATWNETLGAGSWSGTTASGAFNYDYSLNAGEVAVGLLFNWGAAVDIAVLQIFDCSTGACLGVNNDAAHTTVNADTGVVESTPHPLVPGTFMDNGPFAGQHATFEGVAVSAVPVPAAVWLFGSGLLGLVGVARRKKAA